MKEYDIIIVGGGVGGLSAGAVLSQNGKSVLVLEKGISLGGCSSSYKKKDFIFETGATTLIGFDPGHPLDRLFNSIGLKESDLNLQTLNPSMRIHWSKEVHSDRTNSREEWIKEISKKTAKPFQQKRFWNFVFWVSDLVWDLSRDLKNFPPMGIGDIVKILFQIKIKYIPLMLLSFISIERLLKIFGLNEGEEWLSFVNGQLLITAQATKEKVPVTIGCAGLAYAHYKNQYSYGGMIQLAEKLAEKIKINSGEVITKEWVYQALDKNTHWELKTRRGGEYRSKILIWAIPIWNIAKLRPESLRVGSQSKFLTGPNLYGAFTMGIVVRDRFESNIPLHHQFYLKHSISLGGGNSLFVSISAKDDLQRSKDGNRILSISTHVTNPESWNRKDPEYKKNKDFIMNEILSALEDSWKDFKKSDIIECFLATPATWETWTDRLHGRVGGIPASWFFNPFHYSSPRIGNREWRLGDTSYPGQGVSGVALGGLHTALRILKKESWKRSE